MATLTMKRPAIELKVLQPEVLYENLSPLICFYDVGVPVFQAAILFSRVVWKLPILPSHALNLLVSKGR